MQITKEYLDKVLKNLATKNDLKKLATKNELDRLIASQTRRLIEIIDDRVEGLARIINHGFEDIKIELDTRDRVGELEKDVKRIKDALQVR